jgi:hypothetical protein
VFAKCKNEVSWVGIPVRSVAEMTATDIEAPLVVEQRVTTMPPEDCGYSAGYPIEGSRYRRRVASIIKGRHPSKTLTSFTGTCQGRIAPKGIPGGLADNENLDGSTSLPRPA